MSEEARPRLHVCSKGALCLATLTPRGGGGGSSDKHVIWSDENSNWLRDCLWLCQVFRRGLHADLNKGNFARKHRATHNPTSGQPLIVTTMIHTLTHIHLTRALVAVKPRRPPMTDVGNETAFRLDQHKHLQTRKHLLRSEFSWCDQTRVDLHKRRSTVIYMLSVTDFDPKVTIAEVRLHVALYLDILDADRSPNAVRDHAGTTQVDFEVYRSASTCRFSTRRSFDHHSKGNGNFVWKRVSKIEKKSYLSLIWKWWNREMTARLPVTVSSVQLCFYMYAYVKKFSPGSTQLPTCRHLLSPSSWPRWRTHTHTHTHTHRDTHTHTHTPDNRLWSS